MPFIYVLLLLIVSAAYPVQAADAARPEELGVLTRLEEKLRQHPEIAAYVSRAEALRHSSQGELGLPDPMVFISENQRPIGGAVDFNREQEQKSIGFKQIFPAFGARGARSERLGVESVKNRLLGDYAFAAMKAKMITALAKLEAIREQENLLDQQAALTGSERASLKGRIAANLAGVSQLSISQAESADIEIMRADLREEKHEFMAMLINMLGETPEIALPPIEPALWNGDAEQTWPVAIAGQDIKMAQKDVDLRQSEFNPNFEVQVNYGRWNNGDNAGSIMAGVSIPLWVASSQKPRLAGARAAVSAAKFDQANAGRQAIEKLHHLQVRIDASGKKIELLKHKESLLGASAGAQTREYEAGKADFSMPLKTRRDMLATRYQLAAERARRIALIADFNRYIIQGDTE